MAQLSVDETIGAIAIEASRLLGAPFEATPDQLDWLAAKLRVSAADDERWRLIVDSEAGDDLDPERPGDEAMIEFLSDDEAVAAFLSGLLGRYRAAGSTPPNPETGRSAAIPPRPAHSAAFAHVRDRLLALRDDADRAALARLFGAIGSRERDPSTELVALVREIATLGDTDVVKLARWCRTYVTRAGQVPQAASRPKPPAPEG